MTTEISEEPIRATQTEPTHATDEPSLTRKGDLSPLTVTHTSSDKAFDAERVRFAEFAVKEADPAYRQVAAELYRCWWRWNIEYFGGTLKEPHLTIGVTGPRALGFCKPLTDFGAKLQITLNQGVVFGTHKAVRAGWSAKGTRLFVRDILLHEMIHQWQQEIRVEREKSYHGHGPVFCHQCNRIGEDLDLPPVVVRRRGEKDSGRPLCSHWPHNVRDHGFYLDHVDENVCQDRNSTRPSHHSDYKQLIETILGYLKDGRVRQLEEVLEQELRRIERRQRSGTLEFRSAFTQARNC